MKKSFRLFRFIGWESKDPRARNNRNQKIGRSGKIGCRDPTPGVLIGVTLSVGFINDFKREPIRHHQSPTIEKKKETGKEGKMTTDRPLRIVIPTPGPVTTMTYHMPTQPNPVWQSWWMFASPKSLQKEKRTIKWCNNSRMFASGCIPFLCRIWRRCQWSPAMNGEKIKCRTLCGRFERCRNHNIGALDGSMK